MNTNNYKEIAGIIKKRLDELRKLRLTIPNQPRHIVVGIAHQEDALKEIANDLADYFEREFLKGDGEGGLVKEQYFNRQQFLKDAGVK